MSTTHVPSLQIRESSMELLNDASNEYTMGVKLHFQLRMRAKDFDTVMDLHKTAQAIPEKVTPSLF